MVRVGVSLDFKDRVRIWFGETGEQEIRNQLLTDSICLISERRRGRHDIEAVARGRCTGGI